MSINRHLNRSGHSFGHDAILMIYFLISTLSSLKAVCLIREDESIPDAIFASENTFNTTVLFVNTERSHNAAQMSETVLPGGRHIMGWYNFTLVQQTYFKKNHQTYINFVHKCTVASNVNIWIEYLKYCIRRREPHHRERFCRINRDKQYFESKGCGQRSWSWERVASSCYQRSVLRAEQSFVLLNRLRWCLCSA